MPVLDNKDGLELRVRPSVRQQTGELPVSSTGSIQARREVVIVQADLHCPPRITANDKLILTK